MEDIRDLMARPGPFASVCLAVETPTEGSPEHIAARWSNARRQLEAQGADDGAVTAVEAAVIDLRSIDARGVALVADRSGTLVTQLAHEPPEREIIRWGPVPSLVQLLAWREADVPHLLVVTDREGAEIWARRARGQQPDAPHAEVEGDTEHIHRGHPGGWSQRRFQQRAENTWERNAAGVAHEIHELAEKVGAELVVATGDERALGFLEEHLPAPSRERLHVVESGGRSDPDAPVRTAAAADHLVADLVARRIVDALERFAAARGHDLAVEGVDATLAALSQARVETLLVHDDPGDERMAWAAPNGHPVALDRGELDDLRIEPLQGRLVDVAVRAGIASGAQVRAVPAHGPHVPEGHLGGILRG